MSAAIANLKDRLHSLFLCRCEADPDSGCWIWLGAWQRTGLGVVRVAGHLYTAHRVSLWIYRGGFRLPDRNVRVYHRGCRVPACCAPEHLSLARSQGQLNTALARLGRFKSCSSSGNDNPTVPGSRS